MFNLLQGQEAIVQDRLLTFHFFVNCIIIVQLTLASHRNECNECNHIKVVKIGSYAPIMSRGIACTPFVTPFHQYWFQTFEVLIFVGLCRPSGARISRSLTATPPPEFVS